MSEPLFVTAPYACTGCEAQLSGHVLVAGEVLEPDDGSAIVCEHCGAISVVVNCGALRPATEDEHREVVERIPTPWLLRAGRRPL